MNTDRDFERVAAEWLDAGSDSTPPHVIDAVLLAVRTTPQERDLRIPWRTPSMTQFLGVATVIAVVAVVGVAAFYAFGPTFNVGPAPTPSPSVQPTQAPSPTAIPSPNGPIPTGWTTYTSSQYGFTVGHPADWNVRPAERAWDLDTDAPDWLSPAMDDFTAPGGDVRVSVWSLPVDPDMELNGWDGVEAWVELYCQTTGSPSCTGILDGAMRLCIEVRDCHPGLLVGVAPPFDREVQAFFTGGIYNSRMVVVTVWRAEDDPSLAPYGGGRQLIEDFLLTMCVMPEPGHEDRPALCG
jgi:hypothetical protein